MPFLAVNGGSFDSILFSPGGKTMKENDKLLYKTLKTLLNERLSEAEAETLRSEGFEIKNPTRKTAVMVALYKKAASGDLSAIKELRSIVSEKNDDKSEQAKAVMIVDDIRN
jgi:esterase/lipase